jgi:2,4-dienoyl-CoA reductase (NADPH2)
VTDDGLVLKRDGQRQVLEVDTVVICAGQEPERALQEDLMTLLRAGDPSPPLKNVFSIGGSLEAAELDAKRAIDQGTRLGDPRQKKNNYLAR